MHATQVCTSTTFIKMYARTILCMRERERERERDLKSFSEAKREMKAISQPFTYKTKTQEVQAKIIDQEAITSKYELVKETLIIH